MRRSTLGLVGIVCGISILFSALPETGSAQSLSFKQSDSSPATLLLRRAARNARAMGAELQRVGDRMSVVTYSGVTGDYVACRGGDGPLLLDSRTTLMAEGELLRTKTLYIVTYDVQNSGDTSGRASIAFDSNTDGRAGRLSCRATGALERRLMGAR